MRLTAIGAGRSRPSSFCFALGYYYVSFARLLDARLHGERATVLPRVFARPLELRRGQSLTERQLVDRLNDLGYAQRTMFEKPGEFVIGSGDVTIMPARPRIQGPVGPRRLSDGRRRPTRKLHRGGRRSRRRRRRADRVLALERGTRPTERVTLDAPVLTSLINGEREKRRPVALAAIPSRMTEAVLAIEDRRYYQHPGVDPIGIAGALFSYATGRRAVLAGASTITQQVVRNVFLPKFEGMTLQSARARSLKRKLLEQFLAVVLTSRASKDDILEMYLNDVPLGQRGSFAIFGVAEASRLFFGKDVSNVSLAEAATIAGVIQSPSALSPFNNPARAQGAAQRRAAGDGRRRLRRARRRPTRPRWSRSRSSSARSKPKRRTSSTSSIRRSTSSYPGLTTTTNEAVDVYTTLDLHLQRLAQDAVRTGLTSVDKLLSRRKRKGRAEAALIAVDPKTGEILAFVGGRSYNQSQYNRVISSRRQPGSVFKPFVYLAAFEQAAAEGRTDITPGDDRPGRAGNLRVRRSGVGARELPGRVRRPDHLPSRARPFAQPGDDPRRADWPATRTSSSSGRRWASATAPKPYPSIALGVFEATPYEIATAYTIFPNMGTLQPLNHLLKITRGGDDITKSRKAKEQPPRQVTRPDTTFLVTNMMRSVINEGTGAGVRARRVHARCGGQDRDDQRSARRVVRRLHARPADGRLGRLRRQSAGRPQRVAGGPADLDRLHEARARRPLERRASRRPTGVAFADIDPETGQLATPACPHVVSEVFLEGTQPVEFCTLHQFR